MDRILATPLSDKTQHTLPEISKGGQKLPTISKVSRRYG